jgi:hypothetical protein
MARLADKIREANDREEIILDVDAWGVKIGIRSMTAKQRSDMQQRWSVDGEQSPESLYENVLLFCCFDPETGEPAFTDEDLEWLLSEKSAQAIDVVATECLRVSGLASNSVDEVGKDFSDSQEEILS